LADLEEVKAKRLDLSQDAMEPGPVQHAGQDCLRALPLHGQGGKRGQQRGAEMAVDPDQVPGRCRVHAVNGLAQAGESASPGSGEAGARMA
jgi:hypothetical protein